MILHSQQLHVTDTLSCFVTCIVRYVEHAESDPKAYATHLWWGPVLLLTLPPVTPEVGARSPLLVCEAQKNKKYLFPVYC